LIKAIGIDDKAPFAKYLIAAFFLTLSHQATKNYAGVLRHPPISSWLRVFV